MKTVLLTLAFTFAASVFPLLNAELYLAALATQVGQDEIWLMALAAGAGQTCGKILWYEFSARSMDLPWMRRRLESGRFKVSFETWQARMNGRPWASAAVMLCSSIFGFPPLLVTGAVAGALRMRRSIFISTIMVGRTIQSYAILAGLAFVFHAG